MVKRNTSEALTALVLDDQRELAEMLAERLHLEGFQSSVAVTAAEGLTLATQRSFEVAFVDLKLPDMSGIVVAAELRKVRAKMKIFLITGLAASVDEVEPGWTHIDGVLPKPWRPSELEAILQELGRERE